MGQAMAGLFLFIFKMVINLTSLFLFLCNFPFLFLPYRSFVYDLRLLVQCFYGTPGCANSGVSVSCAISWVLILWFVLFYLTMFYYQPLEDSLCSKKRQKWVDPDRRGGGKEVK